MRRSIGKYLVLLILRPADVKRNSHTMDCWNNDRRSLTIETSRLTRRLTIHVRVSCYRTSLSLCGLLGRRHREHEPVASEKLHSFIAGLFVGKTQLNASDLEMKNHDVDI